LVVDVCRVRWPAQILCPDHLTLHTRTDTLGWGSVIRSIAGCLELVLLHTPVADGRTYTYIDGRSTSGH
jgi:hypothetical protein